MSATGAFLCGLYLGVIGMLVVVALVEPHFDVKVRADQKACVETQEVVGNASITTTYCVSGEEIAKWQRAATSGERAEVSR